MKKLKAKGMKILKIFHLILIMIWVVGVIAMAILSMVTPQSGDELYMILKAIRLIDDALVIPGATLTVITAIIYGIFTNWGFFKHRWITVKWIVSIVVIIVGTFYFSPMLDSSIEMADVGRYSMLTNSEIAYKMNACKIGAMCQSAVLLFLVVISVLKPWKGKKDKR